MEKLTTLRIYFAYGVRYTHGGWWKRLWSIPFGAELLKRAKSHDIAQAICFPVSSGYFKGQRIMSLGEVPTPGYPQCVELTDCRDAITRFLTQEKELLGNGNVVMVENEALIIKSR